MEIWATAHSELLSAPLDADPGELPLKVFQNNISTPMILVNKDGSTKIHNMPEEKAEDSVFIKKTIAISFKKENQPIVIDHMGEELATLYYGNSEVLNKLKVLSIGIVAHNFLVRGGNFLLLQNEQGL